MASLAHKTAAGILWNFTEQLGRRGIGAVTTLLLARFLSPEDFGLIAMMAVFLAVGSSLMGSGFKEALMAISVYHRFPDLWEIAQWIRGLGLGYRFHLRHFTIHAEETVLFAEVLADTGR